MGCSPFSSPWVKVNKPGIGWQCEQLWAELSLPIPQQHFSKAGEEPLGACSATGLTESQKSQVLSRSRIFEIVLVPSSILAPASHYRHDGCLGSLAPELSLPHHHLGWQESPESVSAMKISEAAWILILLWFYVWCTKYWCTSNTGWFNG